MYLPGFAFDACPPTMYLLLNCGVIAKMDTSSANATATVSGIHPAPGGKFWLFIAASPAAPRWRPACLMVV